MGNDYLKYGCNIYFKGMTIDILSYLRTADYANIIYLSISQL